MTIANQTLRPGLLVSLKTSLTGNISYEKRVIEPEHTTAEGVEKAKWETVRTITDRAEHKRGREAQLSARGCITKVCTNTAFGLLCPQAQVDDLDRALKEARQIADAFNANAQLSRLTVYVIAGKIAPEDAEAVKAINSEVRVLIKTMEDGVKNLDVDVIRKAANDARKLGAMLSADAAGKVQVAIEAGRAVARKIVKAGEQAAQEVDRGALARLAECRTAFLDLDNGEEVAEVSVEGRAVDLETSTEEETPILEPEALEAVLEPVANEQQPAPTKKSRSRKKK